MVDLLKQKNYDVAHFKPFMDYIEYLESLGYKNISTEESHGFIEEHYEGKDHTLEISTMKDEHKEWVSFYKDRNNVRYEQIEFMAFNEAYAKFSDCRDYNRVIVYAAHFENEEFTHMVCSGYRYLDNKFLDGWRELRKFGAADIDKVIYSSHMNLTELTGIADEKITEFEEIKSLKGKEVKELILGY